MTDFNGINLGLDYLLELDGETFPMDNGYWTKFEATKIDPSVHIPHGIKYSLTLHDKDNMRIMGYDNAHGIKTSKNKFGTKKTEWDHKHERKKIKSYEFENAGQLLEDFWKSVNKIIGNP